MKVKRVHGVKPLYRIKLGNNGYYAADSAWTPVTKQQADKLTHKDALQIRNHLKQPRIGYTVRIEPV